MGKKNKLNISWNNAVDTESEDRIAYLKLTPQGKWDYLMTLILATYPNEEVTYINRNIEWT